MFDLPPTQVQKHLQELRAEKRDCEEVRRCLKMSKQPIDHINEEIAKLTAEINTAQAYLYNYFKGASNP